MIDVNTLSRDELAVRPLTQEDKLGAFNSVNGELNDFLKNDSLKSQGDLISRTYLCFYKDDLVGFIALVADTIEVKVIEIDDGVQGYRYSKYPAIKIARLAIDRHFEKRGIGRFLLLWAIGKVYQVSLNIGCRYITVDSKRESLDFYIKHQFKPVKKYEKRDFPPLYLNMLPIVSALAD